MLKNLTLGICVLLLAALSLSSQADTLEDDFQHPPREAGVRCWWWWLNSNVTQESITRDLEAMHDKGFSGAMIFDAHGANQHDNANVPNGPKFGGPAWTELFMHALNEAKRLDLELGLSIQSGWNLGGPNVSLDDKAKQLTWSEVKVTGGKHIQKKLPRPKANYRYYRDIAVLAYPAKAGANDVSFTMSASSAQSDSPVANIISAQGNWVSGGKKSGDGPGSSRPQWIDITFNKSMTVSGVEIVGRKGYGPRRCRIRFMDTRQKTISFDLKDGTNRLSFDAIKGERFRLIIEDSYDPKYPDAARNVQVSRLELFDEKGSALLGIGRAPIHNLEAKTGVKELGGSAPDCRFLLNHNPVTEGEEDTNLGDIIDLSEQLNDEGILDWDAPDGDWTVLRFGYTPTRAHVSTSSDNWQGHVLDYLSTDAFDTYWYDVVDPLLQKAGDMAGTTLGQLETDSWECGGMNWSPKFAEDFSAYNGYDSIKYLPVIAGKIIDNREASNAFLADFRKTIGHYVSENHYRLFAEHAARYNMGIQPESAGPHAGPLDGIKNYQHSDIVMSEFWIPSPHRPDPPNRFFVKQAASSAHIYGKQFVGAESFTSLRKPHWGVELWHDMKPAMDYEFAEGLNMIFFHTFTSSPKEMGIPGQEYFAGTHVNPQVTWWDQSQPFMDYMARVQSVVQQGKFVADVLYYYGDHVPNIAVNKGFNSAGAYPGYDYDAMNEDVLLQLRVVDGKVVVPGGIHYRVLVLPDHRVLSFAALKKVVELLGQGATILGPKPERLVSLVGGDATQRTFHKLATEVWGENPGRKGIRNVGKGRVVWGESARKFLQEDGVRFDFEALDIEKQSDYEYIHYTVDGGDVYFVSNQTNETAKVDVAFRVTGKQPELWNPVTGEITGAGAFTQGNGRTVIPMEFDPFGSCLVLFRKSISGTEQGSANSNYRVLETVRALEGPWTVAFDTEWGGPASIAFKALTDWTKHKDEGIKFYSGAATYTNNFELQPVEGKRYWLELNNVKDAGVASVKLNGEDIGITWTKPFQLEMTQALNAGKNEIEITVINTWQNRLIGDRGKKQNDRYTETNILIRKEWELRPSGLLGPVEIKCN